MVSHKSISGIKTGKTSNDDNAGKAENNGDECNNGNEDDGGSDRHGGGCDDGCDAVARTVATIAKKGDCQ